MVKYQVSSCQVPWTSFHSHFFDNDAMVGVICGGSGRTSKGDVLVLAARLWSAGFCAQVFPRNMSIQQMVSLKRLQGISKAILPLIPISCRACSAGIRSMHLQETQTASLSFWCPPYGQKTRSAWSDWVAELRMKMCYWGRSSFNRLFEGGRSSVLVELPAKWKKKSLQLTRKCGLCYTGAERPLLNGDVEKWRACKLNTMKVDYNTFFFFTFKEKKRTWRGHGNICSTILVLNYFDSIENSKHNSLYFPQKHNIFHLYFCITEFHYILPILSFSTSITRPRSFGTSTGGFANRHPMFSISLEW